MNTNDLRKAISAHAGLTTEQRQIVDLLALGKTQPEIGRALGMHRSAVWRRIKKLKAMPLK